MPLVNSPVTIFLVVLAIILVVPLLLQRLRLPYVIGLILAGMAVGPFGFDVLARDMSFKVFGEVGLLYLMFLAGLEIDRYHLRRNLGKGAVFGAMTFAVPLVAGFAASVTLLGLGALPALLLGAMFAAHTLLAYPIVARFGLTRSTAAVIAVAGTIFAVIGSLVVLAVVGAVARTGSFTPLDALWLLARLAVIAAGVWLLYPPVTRRFFRHYSDGIAQFAYILAMMLLAACAARWLGIEGVFGAFLAGLTLNRFVPRRGPLMSRLEFVGNAIFIPYFLIGVGMLIDVKVLFDGWHTLYVAAVMSAVAMLTKWGAAWATQLIFRLSGPSRSLIYQLTNAHTAVALAVVTIGWQLGLIDSAVINATVVMILVTCTVSSIGAERASRRLKLRQLKRGTDDAPAAGQATPRAGNMLITLSNPTTAPRLVELAMLMRPAASRSALYALHVRNDNSTGSLANARASLEAAAGAAAAVDTTLTPLERFDNNVVTGVLHTIAERDTGEILLGLHRRTAFIDSFLGPKIEQLIASTTRMVVIARVFTAVNTMRRMVVYVPEKAEFETGFRRWVDALATLAAGLGCTIVWHAYAATTPIIMQLLAAGAYGVETEWVENTSPDDLLLLSNTIADDDLFVCVTARRASVSFDGPMDEWPVFLQRYFSACNLMMIYPEQFGDGTEQPSDASMAAVLAPDFAATPSPLLRRLRSLFPHI